MSYDNLSEFLEELQDHGELSRVAVEVDPHLEIAEITRRVSASSPHAPALFFERVLGSPYPVVTNLLGTESRLCRALRTRSFAELSQRVTEFLHLEIPNGWFDQLKLMPQLAQMGKLPPKVVRTGACQQIVHLGRDVQLTDLPFLQSWPAESARALTLPQAVTKHPVQPQRAVSRVQLVRRDATTCRLIWSPHDGGLRNLQAYQQQSQRMPVALVLGGDPALAYAAAAPIPTGIDPWLIAGYLRGEALELVKCRTIDLEVPASAELVIEGYIDPSEPWEPAGTCASPGGYYSLDGDAPLLHVTAVTQRANPVVPVTILGRTLREEQCLSQATERLFLPLVKLLLPEIVDWSLPRSGGVQNLLCVSIRKSYPLQARKVLSTLWGLAPLLFAKLTVVVEEPVDVHNLDEVWFQVGANVHPARDVVMHDGPGSPFDHATPTVGTGRFLGFDATRKTAAEGHPREWPAELIPSPAVRELVTERWHEYRLNLPSEPTR